MPSFQLSIIIFRSITIDNIPICLLSYAVRPNVASSRYGRVICRYMDRLHLGFSLLCDLVPTLTETRRRRSQRNPHISPKNFRVIVRSYVVGDQLISTSSFMSYFHHICTVSYIKSFPYRGFLYSLQSSSGPLNRMFVLKNTVHFFRRLLSYISL